MSMFSMPFLSVTEEEGQPTHEPCSSTYTIPFSNLRNTESRVSRVRRVSRDRRARRVSRVR
jgi:hypothetical protein